MRQEFTKRVKLDAWERCGGRCEGNCGGAKLYPGKYEFHHDTECTFGGQATADNCLVLCIACHSAITRKRASVIAKSNRVRERHLGIKRVSGRPLPGTKASGWRRKLNGTWERRQ